MIRLGAMCDRCGKPFIARIFPAHICRACHLGALSPVERAIELVSGGVR